MNPRFRTLNPICKPPATPASRVWGQCNLKPRPLSRNPEPESDNGQAARQLYPIVGPGTALSHSWTLGVDLELITSVPRNYVGGLKII